MTQNSIYNTASSLAVDNISLDGNTISSTDTNGNIVLAPDGSGVVSVTTAAIVPSGDRADSLGSATNSWDNVYCDGVSFDDGTNVLASYSQGTFTPSINFGGVTTGITYSVQEGIYWRIGDVVYCTIAIVLTSKGSASGSNALRIVTLPLSVDSSKNGQTPPYQPRMVNTAQRGSNTQFHFLLDQTDSAGELTARTCGDGTNVNLQHDQCTDTSEFYLSVFYVTDA